MFMTLSVCHVIVEEVSPFLLYKAASAHWVFVNAELFSIWLRSRLWQVIATFWFFSFFQPFYSKFVGVLRITVLLDYWTNGLTFESRKPLGQLNDCKVPMSYGCKTSPNHNPSATFTTPPKSMHVSLICDSELTPRTECQCRCLCVSFGSVWLCDGLVTCPGCTLPLTQWQLI